MGTVFFYTLRESLSRRMGLVMVVLSGIVPSLLLYWLSLEKTPEGGFLVVVASQKMSVERFAGVMWSALLNFAQNLGTFIALFVTAALLVSYLERGWADMLLTKGVSRWRFLLARMAACLALFATMAFMVGAVPGLYLWARTGVSIRNFLLALGLVALNFLFLLSLLVLVSMAQPNVPVLVLTGFLQITFSAVLASRKGIVEFFNRPWLGPPLDFLYTILPRTREVNDLANDVLRAHATANWSPLWWSIGLAVVYTALACYALHRKSF